MDIARSYQQLDNILESWRREKRRVALVPTMGSLHEGHLSLIKIAKDHANKCVVSLYVNPTQFSPDEDFATYPRDEDGDLEKMRQAGVDLIYIPSEKDMYPQGPMADLTAGPVAEGMEGEIRPHFFNGVVSIVARLFDQIRPDVAVFGEKDYQQLAVVRELSQTLNTDIEIIGGPIMRDEEGLALSSRNAYLSETELKIARRLNKILFELAETLRGFPGEAYDLVSFGVQRLREAGFDAVDYVELRDAVTLKPVSKLGEPARILAAVRIGNVRLIDNVPV